MLNHLNFGTHIKKPDSMNHVKLIEFHKDSANCKAFVKDYNSLAKTVCFRYKPALSLSTIALRRRAVGPETVGPMLACFSWGHYRSGEGRRDRKTGEVAEAERRQAPAAPRLLSRAILKTQLLMSSPATGVCTDAA